MATTWDKLADPDKFIRPTEESSDALDVELDARELDQDDGSTVSTWSDQSGNSNDATGVGTPQFETTGWGATAKDVRLKAATNSIRLLGADSDTFTYDGTVLAATDLTVFAVVNAVDISTKGIPIIGSKVSSTPPRGLYLLILSDGSVVFDFGNTPFDVQSAAGVVETGDDVLISATFSTSTGKILRVNGTQVGTSAGTASIIGNLEGVLGRAKHDGSGLGNFFGNDKKFAWISGYSSTASAADVVSMEGYLADRFGIPGIASASKPTIASAEFEYDVTLLDQADGSTVDPWPDQTANSADATADNTPVFEVGGWGVNDHFTFDGSGLVAKDVTIFAVARIEDLTTAAPIFGGSSTTDLEQLKLQVNANGSVLFSFSDDGGGDAITSATGAIVGDGTCFLIVATHSSDDGKVLRVNGVQVAADASSTSDLSAWTNSFIGNVKSSTFPIDMRIAWLSTYASVLDLCRIEQMEGYLMDKFCSELNLPSGLWCDVTDPSTTWTKLGDP